MYDNGDKMPRVKLEVALEFGEGASLLGFLFLSPGGRLSDMLNDSRDFLPVETLEGTTIVVRKDAIVRATPLMQAQAQPVTSNDPYKILGVVSDVSHSDLKARYHEMARDVHPDRLHSMGLPEPFIDFANTQLARINNAYQKICKERNFDQPAATAAAE